MEKSLHLDGEMGVTEKVRKSIFNICKEYLYIGFLLYEVSRYEYFKEKNYTSVYDYALQELGFKKSSVKNFIAVFREFSYVDNYGNHCMWLKDKYENFKYSQLCEMLSLSENQRKLIHPDMTIKQIRLLKHDDDNIVSVPVSGSGQTSGQMILITNQSELDDFYFDMKEKIRSGKTVELTVGNVINRLAVV